MNDFSKWQEKQCANCKIGQNTFLCSQIKYNFIRHQNGELSLETDCPFRENP